MPEPKPIARLVPVAVADSQTCFLCAESESRAELTRTLMLAEIRRLEGEIEKRDRALHRESHLLDPREPHRRKA